MSIKIEEVDDNLTRVVWDVAITHSSGEQNETFVLYKFNSFIHLCVSCKFELKKESVSSSSTRETSKFNISLCLAGAKRRLTDESDFRLTHPFPSNSRNRIHAVWASVNGGPQSILQGSGTTKTPKWSTKKPSTIKLQRSNMDALLQFKKSKQKDFSYDLKCEFWIEFDDLIDSQKKALQHITACYENQTRCDVQFYFENGDHIGGHFLILAARSPVFEAMFQHPMSETETGRVDIFDIEPEIFDQLLKFIYSGRIGTPLNEDNAKSLYEVADKYDVEDLKEKCAKFLPYCVNLNNAIDYLIWADLHSVENLKETAVKKIVEHAEEICEMDAWENFMKNFTDLCLSVTRRMMKKKHI